MVYLKTGMWAVGLLVLSLFGVVLVNLFGNITVTDQLNYTSMKNSVEAAMYDALDVAHYRAGFCLCTNTQKKDGKYSFTDDNQYALFDITYDKDNNPVCGTADRLKKYKNCDAIYGDYRIKPEVFAESLIRRFAEMVNNSKDYTITIQDVIEYPPKVSVRISSKDAEFSPTEENKAENEYYIVNQLDAIIETHPGFVPTPAPTPVPPPQKTTITIKPVDEEVVYNGAIQYATKHVCNLVGGSLPLGSTINCQTSASGKDAGSYPKTASSYAIISGGKDITSNYNIIVEPGKFVITPTTLEIICKNPSAKIKLEA